MASKKRGLGRGLSALISDESQVDLFHDDVDKGSIINIDISMIEANEEQPRKDFEEKSLEELKESIIQHGVIQPLVVRKKGNKYQIITGERRWRASKAANLKKVPCIIKEIDDKEVIKLALIENLQREDLNPIEEAYAFKGLIEDYDLTQEEVAQSVGKSRSYIANTMRLLKLNKEIIDYIFAGKMSSGHGKALLGVKDNNRRLKIAKIVVENNLNVRETEKLVNNTKKKKARTKAKPVQKDPFIEEIEENLMRMLGTKVTLTTNKKGGKIEVEFYGNEDLDRIIELLTN
ncbi:ParB/RepB/Spo0J family partition protein [Schnuerera sp. xch1]|uniref:ParB/RepB/Spo0J family partition protein n=1 Tax=Schnuerera sp. xch1 TaxID=2874283 RepID=UPI001CBD80E3|nr:ParB/RepB/Spo0J family partition protein [Schnuerera sp. xch1]MBZ2175689.1 ParB/RepB/Spo0J family partition protein [Schnuerera sp. xch1]